MACMHKVRHAGKKTKPARTPKITMPKSILKKSLMIRGMKGMQKAFQRPFKGLVEAFTRHFEVLQKAT